MPPSGQEDLFSCCQRTNFRGAPCSFFAIHIAAALVLFMTDGMMVSLPPKHALLRGLYPGTQSELARRGEHRGSQSSELVSCPSPTVPKAHENQESVLFSPTGFMVNSRKRPVCCFVCFISNSMWPKIFQF